MKIEGPDGKTLATVKEAVVTPVRDRWTVKSGPDLDVQGKILDLEYRIGEGRQKVGGVSKERFRLRDSCRVEVAEGQGDGLIFGCHGSHRHDGPPHPVESKA
jgi:uncharacterized protein YxjI